MGTKSAWPKYSAFFGQLFDNDFVKKINELTSPLQFTKYLNRFGHYFKEKEPVFLDTDGTVLSWNESSKRLQGYSETEIVGQKLSIFYMPLDRQKHLPEEQIKNAEANGAATVKGKWVRKDGTTFLGSMIIRSVRSVYNNKLIGFTEEIYPLTDDAD